MTSPRFALGRVLRGAAVVAALHAAAGCYRYAPLEPGGGTRGQDVTVEISDRGRVTLGEALGPYPFRVSGRLLTADDTALTLGVRTIETIRGETTTWTGDQVTLPRSAITGVQSRRLDRRRTALLAGTVVTAVVAFFVTRSLTTSGSVGDPVPPTPPGIPPSS